MGGPAEEQPLSVVTAAPSLATRSTTFIGTVSLAGQVADKLFSFGQIMLIAATFGATAASDLYFLASIVPLTIGWVVGEPTGRAAMTLLVRAEGSARSTTLAASGLICVVGVLLVLTGLYLVAALLVVQWTAPAGASAFGPWIAFALAAPAMGAVGYMSGLLVWLERYAWATLRFPAASLAGLVLTWLALRHSHALLWVGLAVSAGYAIAAIVLFAAIARALGWGWAFHPTRAGLREVLARRRMIFAPVVGAVFGGQPIVLIERALSAGLGVGFVSSISYARGIATAPTVVGQAVGASGYPALVRAEAADSKPFLQASFLRGFRLALLAGIVTGSFLVLFGPDVVSAVFQRGHFDSGPAERTGTLLTIFGLSTFTGSMTAYLMHVLYGINRFRGVLVLELAIFGSYVVAALLLRQAFGINGLAAALGVAQGVGAVVATTIAIRAVGLGGGMLLRAAVAPVVVRGALVVAVLGVWRFLSGRLGEAVELRDLITVGGGAICLVAASAAVLLFSGLPESAPLRRVVFRRT